MLEVLDGSAMSMYEGAKKRIRADSWLSKM